MTIPASSQISSGLDPMATKLTESEFLRSLAITTNSFSNRRHEQGSSVTSVALDEEWICRKLSGVIKKTRASLLTALLSGTSG